MVPPVEADNQCFGKTVSNGAGKLCTDERKSPGALSLRVKSHVTRSKTVRLQDWHLVHSADLGLVATTVLASGRHSAARGNDQALVRRLLVNLCIETDFSMPL